MLHQIITDLVEQIEDDDQQGDKIGVLVIDVKKIIVLDGG